MDAPKGWGLTPPEGTRYHWSARAIYRDFAIDTLWDRSGIEGECSDEERAALIAWLDTVGFPALRAQVKSEWLEPRERREISISGDGFRLRANPNASHGYLYLSAAPDPTATGPTPKPPPQKTARAPKLPKLVRRSRTRGPA